MIRNTPTGFGKFSKIMHWLMAAIIFTLIIVGIYMGDLPKVTDDEKQLILQLHEIHKSLGVIIMLLVALRLAWMIAISPNPSLPEAIADKERIFIKAIKKLLYFMMLILPMNGYLMSNANGHTIEFFGLFELPVLISKSETFSSFLYGMHMIVGWLMLIVVLAHVAGVLKYRLENEGTDKDILQRML